MNLRAAFLARSATANPDGSFDIVGGGVTEFQLNQGLILGAPIRLQFATFLRLELDETEIEQLVPISLELLFEGQPLGSTTVPFVGRRIAGESRYYHNAILSMTIDVPRPGNGEIRVTWDGGLATIPPLHFRVGSNPASR